MYYEGPAKYSILGFNFETCVSFSSISKRNIYLEYLALPNITYSIPQKKTDELDLVCLTKRRVLMKVR
jgi:hypothetical protein